MIYSSMKIHHLKMVKAVSEEKTLTDAARKLHLSQSALSHQLRNLEEELNVSVFKRVNKKMLLTQAGQLILESSQKILSELNSTKREVGKLVNGEAGTIRLSTQCYTCYHWLPPIIKIFKNQYPNVKIEIKSDSRTATINNLLNGELDIALVHNKSKNSNIRYTAFLYDELVTIFNADHPFREKEVILPKDFKEQTLITHFKEFEASILNQKVLKRYNIVPGNIIHVQLTGAALEMVRANLGVTVMPYWIASRYLEKYELACLPLTRNGLVKKWIIATLQDSITPPYIDYFIKLLTSKEQIFSNLY